jgi:hypothetical protein
MLRRDLLKTSLAAGVATAVSGGTSTCSELSSQLSNDRGFWLGEMQRVVHPVLSALSQRRLREVMPVEIHPEERSERGLTTYLEAFGRTLAGIAQWLEESTSSGKEGELRAKYRTMTRQALTAGVDPSSPDYMRFGTTAQSLVDAGFLALAVLRAPRELNAKLDPDVRAQLANGLRATRSVRMPLNNWLLFAAVVEAALYALGQPWDRMRVDLALNEHMSWYHGDGAYGDGPNFHWDYYNSFVIQPFLLAILDTLGKEQDAWTAMIPKVLARASRYAHVLERLIAPDGSYPVLGRSVTYRGGAFHLLGDIALRHALPDDVAPEQVRCALSAVLHRTLGPQETFDKDGWLRIGLAGHQPSLGEGYISTGSLYLCATTFLPLGLPKEDRFWSAADAPWSSQRLWRGEDMAPDHAIEI